MKQLKPYMVTFLVRVPVLAEDWDEAVDIATENFSQEEPDAPGVKKIIEVPRGLENCIPWNRLSPNDKHYDSDLSYWVAAVYEDTKEKVIELAATYVKILGLSVSQSLDKAANELNFARTDAWYFKSEVEALVENTD